MLAAYNSYVQDKIAKHGDMWSPEMMHDHSVAVVIACMNLTQHLVQMTKDNIQVMGKSLTAEELETTLNYFDDGLKKAIIDTAKRMGIEL